MSTNVVDRQIPSGRCGVRFLAVLYTVDLIRIDETYNADFSLLEVQPAFCSLHRKQLGQVCRKTLTPSSNSIATAAAGSTVPFVSVHAHRSIACALNTFDKSLPHQRGEGAILLEAKLVKRPVNATTTGK